MCASRILVLTNPTSGRVVDGLATFLWVLLAILSVALIGLVLIHRGRGGGITDVFGGGIASGIQSSAVGERNLTRTTWAVAVLWGLIIVLLGLIDRFTF